MTIARDIRTGKVVGQVLHTDRYDFAQDTSHPFTTVLLTLLTRDGTISVDAASVRLEEVSDR